LSFGSERHLAEVYASLKKSRGRRLTRDVFDQRQFVLEGTDGDGSSFYVTAVENNGAVRGLSIVYANRASEPLVKAIAASFSPFPGATAPPASPPADPGVTRSEPAPSTPPLAFSRPPTANPPPAPEEERSALRCTQSAASYITVRPADPQRDGCSGAACYVFENTCPALPIKVRYQYSLGAGAACGPLQDAENTAPREESGKPGSFLDWSCSRPTIVGAEFEN
jgi:hypothetical protein